MKPWFGRMRLIAVPRKDDNIFCQINNQALPALKEKIRRKYEKLARWYDLMDGLPEILGVRKLRRELLQRAFGWVLEIAVGTGRNPRYYPRSSNVIAVDFSQAMLMVARKRADRLGRWQDRRADRHARALGCRWNREPLDLVRQAGPKLLAAQRIFFGVFHLLETMPSEPAPAYIAPEPRSAGISPSGCRMG